MSIDKEIEKKRTFAKPSLFIREDNSGYIQERATDAIRKLFPHAQIATIPGAVHWVHTERKRDQRGAWIRRHRSMGVAEPSYSIDDLGKSDTFTRVSPERPTEYCASRITYNN